MNSALSARLIFIDTPQLIVYPVLFVYPRSTKPQHALLLPTRTVFAHLVKILLIAVYQRPVQPVATKYVLSAPVDITSPVRRAAWLVLFVLQRSTRPQSALLLPTRTVFAHLVKISLIVEWKRPARPAPTRNVQLVLQDSGGKAPPAVPLAVGHPVLLDNSNQGLYVPASKVWVTQSLVPIAEPVKQELLMTEDALVLIIVYVQAVHPLNVAQDL